VNGFSLYSKLQTPISVPKTGVDIPPHLWMGTSTLFGDPAASVRPVALRQWIAPPVLLSESIVINYVYLILKSFRGRSHA